MRAVITVLLGIFLISACGAGNEAAQSGAAEPAAGVEKAAKPDRAKNGTSFEANQSTAAGRKAPEQVKLPPSDREIIYTAKMRVRVEKLPASVAKVTRIIGAAGGYIAREETRDSGDRSSSDLELKVSPDRYAGLISQLGALGKRLSLKQETEDVTEEVADVESRIKSAEAGLKRLRDLLGEANGVSDVLTVQRELGKQESELESLQARQKSLAKQTGMATIKLHLLGPRPEREEPADDTGFLAGLAAGWRSFVDAVKAGVTVFGVLLPWLVFGGIVAAIAVWIRRRIRARRPTTADPEPQPGSDSEPEPASKSAS